jgi:hypothetical protein
VKTMETRKLMKRILSSASLMMKKRCRKDMIRMNNGIIK